MHYTEFEKQLASVFQVKIKDDYITNLFESVNAKINQLDSQIHTLTADNTHTKLQQLVHSTLHSLITQQLQTRLDPITQKVDSLVAQTAGLRTGQEETNVRLEQQFKRMENRLGVVQEQQRESGKERESVREEVGRMRSELKMWGTKGSAIERAVNHYIQQSSIKSQKYQHDIQNIWSNLQASSPQSTNKRRQQKHSVFYELNEAARDHSHNQDLTQPSFHRNKNPRKSAQDGVRIKGQSRRQSKPVEYTSLLLKIELLQKKVEDSLSKALQHKNNEDSSHCSHQSLHKNDNKLVIEKRRAKPANAISRLNRSSVHSKPDNGNFQSDASRDECADVSGLWSEVRKVSDKLGELKFKYTLLQQNHEILLNKISRVTQMQSAMQGKMDDIEKLRIDLSTIQEINMRFRTIQANYQEQDYKYLLTQLYTKDLKLTRDAIKDIEAKINKMANKEEVKEAFVFIETKIKEMALVITDKFQSQKEGAINKIKEVKCLTCDKEIQDPYSQLRRSLNTMQHSRNVKISNQLSKLKRKARATQKKIKTEGSDF